MKPSIRSEMTLVALLLCTALALIGQNAPGDARVSETRAQPALEKQRAAARKQAGGLAEGAHAFFTVPWMDAAAAAPHVMEAAYADCEALAAETLDPLIARSAQQQNVSPALIRAVIQRESGGRPCAVSRKGAQGMMQLMPATLMELGVTNPFDATENISAGTRYLKQLLLRYSGNTKLALAAYNAGPNRVEPNGKVPGIPETESYVADVLSMLEEAKGAESKQN